MAEVLGTKGAELDLLIRQGCTFGPHEGTMINPNGTRYNLTGCTFAAQIRKLPSSPTASATATFTITSAVNGEFTWKFSDTQTAALLADDSGEDSPTSQYVWDMEMIDAAGNKNPVMYGKVMVFREVTR